MGSRKATIAVAKGDGIGPEIMEATLFVLEEAGASLEILPVTIGEKVFLKGIKSGIEPETWEVLKKTEAFLKAPITTPQGGGFKSVNVTIRGAFGLFANVRPAVSYFPYVATKHPQMDVVIIRENEEDLYTGIEYHQSWDTTTALKIISRSGSSRIIRYAFEYALANGRKKVTCFSKDNILKLTDGLFHKCFDEIAKEYPQLEHEHWIIDIGSAKLADTPENFDVIVMPNLYGDILSDVAAQIAGSVGLAGSANIGYHQALFEAIHGSAPRRAGQNVANPSGLLLASVMMLNHLGQGDTGEMVHNAWLKTIEEGIHTYDIFKEGTSKVKVGTKEFAEAVVKNLGKKPLHLKAALKPNPVKLLPEKEEPSPPKTQTGCDLFIEWHGTVDALVEKARALSSTFELESIQNRGTEVYPHNQPETLLCDQFRLRYKGRGKTSELIHSIEEKGFNLLQIQNLFVF